MSASKRIYVSADYDIDSGDRCVVDEMKKWVEDNRRNVSFVDMAKVISGTVADNPDCRACDLKEEFNRQINVSSIVVVVVGDKTATRTAGSACQRANLDWLQCFCTPYKQNSGGKKQCKVFETVEVASRGDVGNVNSYSYLRHEYEQAAAKGKKIIVLYNSMRNETSWLPYYLKEREAEAMPFWVKDAYGRKVGDYSKIKEALGF